MDFADDSPPLKSLSFRIRTGQHLCSGLSGFGGDVSLGLTWVLSTVFHKLLLLQTVPNGWYQQLPTWSFLLVSEDGRTHTVLSTCANTALSFPSSQVAARVEGLRCVHVCFPGWPLSPPTPHPPREEEDFGTTLSATGTFHYPVTVIWVNSALCLNIPELTVTSSVHLSVYR